MNPHHYVVLPTYNERENIENILRAIYANAPYVRVLVVDDSSPDGTADIVRNLMKEFPLLSLTVRATKDGLGRAYIHGFKKVLEDTDATSVLMMDADLSHDPKCIPELHKKIQDVEVAIGSRYIPGGAVVGWELWRRILSRGGNIYARCVTRLPINDLTGGFNCIRASLLRTIDLESITSSGYAFIIELKYTLWKAGAHFAQIPIIFKNRTGGESKISNHIITEGIIAPWKLILRQKKIK